MIRWILSGVGGFAAVAVAVTLWQSESGGQSQTPTPPAAGASQAQGEAHSQGEDWGAPDGGSVVIKANGAYSMILTDASDNSSVFSEGRVSGRHPTPDGGHAYTLKPTTPGQAGWTFEVLAKPDGSAELWVTKAGARHLVSTLKK